MDEYKLKELSETLCEEMIQRFNEDVRNKLFDWSKIWDDEVCEDSDVYYQIEKEAMKRFAVHLVSTMVK